MIRRRQKPSKFPELSTVGTVHVEPPAWLSSALACITRSCVHGTLVAFKKAETPMGTPMEMRIDRADLVTEMETNGFRVDAEHAFLPYQYFLVFKMK